MAKRWSKLQSRLYNIIDPSVKFQIHCVLYEMNSNDGWHGSKLPRYFITIGKDVIFDYPKDFTGENCKSASCYPWLTDMEEISCLLEEYIQCPKEELMKDFVNDNWGITDILRVCDKRVGKRRLRKLRDTVKNEVLLNIIQKRLNGNNNIYSIQI